MTTIRAKLKRDRIDLDIASVRFSPAHLYQPPELANHAIWLRAAVLDDLLLPYVEIMRGNPNNPA